MNDCECKLDWLVNLEQGRQFLLCTVLENTGEVRTWLDTRRLRINFPVRWFRFSLRTRATAALT